MKIYLIRHGKTEWNLQHKMQGQRDSPLIEEGLIQLRLLGERLNNECFQAVYSSPLKRAVQSARVVFPGTELILRDELKEIALGDWEGRNYQQVKDQPLEEHEEFWEKPHLFQARPGGGEDIFAVKERVVSLFNELISRHSFQDSIALVSHTVVIKALLMHVEKRSMKDFWNPPFIYPASLSMIEYDKNELSLSFYGSITHYEDQFTVQGRL